MNFTIGIFTNPGVWVKIPLLLLHNMKLLQLGLVLSLHATQHVTYNHHESVKLKQNIFCFLEVCR